MAHARHDVTVVARVAGCCGELVLLRRAGHYEIVADVVDWLASAPACSVDAICLHVDNGPEWLVTPVIV